MQLAISTYSLSRWRKENGKSLEQAIDWIAASGVGAIEFSSLDERLDGPPDVDPLRRAAALRRRCEKAGLPIVSYCVGAELLVPPAEQRKVVQELKKRLDIGQALGVATMRHDVTRGPKGPGKKPSLSAVLKSLVEPIRQVSDYAQQRGIKTSLENHGFYLQAADVVEKLLKTVDHPNFGLTMDVGNFLCVDQDPVAAVGRLAKYAIMVHAKDFHQRPKDRMPPSGWFATPASYALRGAIAGHGVIDLPAQLRALKKAGYDGWLSLEFEGMEEPTRAITLGLDYLRGQLAAL